MEAISNSEEETSEISKKIAQKIGNGGLLLLEGELGTGKTLFTKHFLASLGVPLIKAKSPTYTYIREHKVKGQKIYHLDLYRIEKYDHLLTEEIEELLNEKNNIVIIEWANKMPEIEKQHPRNIKITLEYISPTTRKLKINENI